MRNIFKTFKENKDLLEKNKILKAQNEALMQFKESFDAYYRNISGVHIIPVNYDNRVVLNGTYTFDPYSMNYPVDMCKEHIAHDMAKKLLQFIEFDVVDNRDYNTKDLVGRLIILTK